MKSKCKKIINQYLENGYSNEIKNHISECEKCARLINIDIEKINQDFDFEPSDYLEESLVRYFRKKQAKPSIFYQVFKPIAVISFVCLFFIIGFLSINNLQKPNIPQIEMSYYQEGISALEDSLIVRSLMTVGDILAIPQK